MSVSMYSVSIPVFIQHLNGLNTVLDKAASWAAARKVNEADLLNMRLSPDMFNLARQVRAATDHAINATGRLSGKELVKFANDETTIAQLKDRVAKTIDYLKSVKQNEIDGTETKDISITFPSGQTRQFTGQSLLLGNSLPNFYFHATTAYDIIRHRAHCQPVSSLGLMNTNQGVCHESATTHSVAVGLPDQFDACCNSYAITRS